MTEFLLIEDREDSSITDENQYIVQADSEEEARSKFKEEYTNQDIGLIKPINEIMDENHRDLQSLF